MSRPCYDGLFTSQDPKKKDKAHRDLNNINNINNNNFRTRDMEFGARYNSGVTQEDYDDRFASPNPFSGGAARSPPLAPRFSSTRLHPHGSLKRSANATSPGSERPSKRGRIIAQPTARQGRDPSTMRGQARAPIRRDVVEVSDDENDPSDPWNRASAASGYISARQSRMKQISKLSFQESAPLVPNSQAWPKDFDQESSDTARNSSSAKQRGDWGGSYEDVKTRPAPSSSRHNPFSTTSPQHQRYDQDIRELKQRQIERFQMDTAVPYRPEDDFHFNYGADQFSTMPKTASPRTKVGREEKLRPTGRELSPQMYPSRVSSLGTSLFQQPRATSKIHPRSAAPFTEEDPDSENEKSVARSLFVDADTNVEREHSLDHHRVNSTKQTRVPEQRQKTFTIHHDQGLDSNEESGSDLFMSVTTTYQQRQLGRQARVVPTTAGGTHDQSKFSRQPRENTMKPPVVTVSSIDSESDRTMRLRKIQADAEAAARGKTRIIRVTQDPNANHQSSTKGTGTDGQEMRGSPMDPRVHHRVPVANMSLQQAPMPQTTSGGLQFAGETTRHVNEGAGGVEFASSYESPLETYEGQVQQPIPSFQLSHSDDIRLQNTPYLQKQLEKARRIKEVAEQCRMQKEIPQVTRDENFAAGISDFDLDREKCEKVEAARRAEVKRQKALLGFKEVDPLKSPALANAVPTVPPSLEEDLIDAAITGVVYTDAEVRRFVIKDTDRRVHGWRQKGLNWSEVTALVKRSTGQERVDTNHIKMRQDLTVRKLAMIAADKELEDRLPERPDPYTDNTQMDGKPASIWTPHTYGLDEQVDGGSSTVPHIEKDTPTSQALHLAAAHEKDKLKQQEECDKLKAEVEQERHKKEELEEQIRAKAEADKARQKAELELARMKATEENNKILHQASLARRPTCVRANSTGFSFSKPRRNDDGSQDSGDDRRPSIKSRKKMTPKKSAKRTKAEDAGDATDPDEVSPPAAEQTPMRSHQKKRKTDAVELRPDGFPKTAGKSLPQRYINAHLKHIEKAPEETDEDDEWSPEEILDGDLSYNVYYVKRKQWLHSEAEGEEPADSLVLKCHETTDLKEANTEATKEVLCPWSDAGIVFEHGMENQLLFGSNDGMVSNLLTVPEGCIKVWVEKEVCTAYRGKLPKFEPESFIKRKIWIVKKQTSILETADSEDQDQDQQLPAQEIGPVCTTFDLANKEASDKLLDATFVTTATRYEDVLVQKSKAREEAMEILRVLEEQENLFSGEDTMKNGQLVKVWVEESELKGPRN